MTYTITAEPLRPAAGRTPSADFFGSWPSGYTLTVAPLPESCRPWKELWVGMTMVARSKNVGQLHQVANRLGVTAFLLDSPDQDADYTPVRDGDILRILSKNTL